MDALAETADFGRSTCGSPLQGKRLLHHRPTRIKGSQTRVVCPFLLFVTLKGSAFFIDSQFQPFEERPLVGVGVECHWCRLAYCVTPFG